MPRRARVSRIEALALDLWYTTWYHRARERANYHRAKRHAWLRTLGDVGVEASTARGELDRLRAKLNGLEGRGQASTLEQQARWVGEWLGVRLDTQQLIERLDRALSHAAIHPTPGIRAFLAEAHARGMPVGMVSNICDESPGGIRARLASEGLLPFFDSIALSSEFGKAKPDPSLFRHCFQELGARPDRVLFIGDMPVDRQGAQNAGAQFVMYLGVDRDSPLAYRRKRRAEPAGTPRASNWSQVRARFLG